MGAPRPLPRPAPAAPPLAPPATRERPIRRSDPCPRRRSTRAASSTPAPSRSATPSATGSSCRSSTSASCPGLLDRIPLWSARRRAPARLRRSDYLGDPSVPLAEAARELVAAELGSAPAGPVRLLANPRYWGIGMNPVAFYYLHGDGPGEPVEAMIAEVTNTPWGERRAYVLDARGPGAVPAASSRRPCTSPRSCRWSSATAGRPNEPGERLRVRIANHEGGRRVFEAGIDLRRREIAPRADGGSARPLPADDRGDLRAHLRERAALKLKGVPYFRNPSKER